MDNRYMYCLILSLLRNVNKKQSNSSIQKGTPVLEDTHNVEGGLTQPRGRNICCASMRPWFKCPAHVKSGLATSIYYPATGAETGRSWEPTCQSPSLKEHQFRESHSQGNKEVLKKKIQHPTLASAYKFGCMTGTHVHGTYTHTPKHIKPRGKCYL